MGPSITVLLTNHNYEEYLVGALRSALSQEYDNFRICLIDDGSKDQVAVNKIVGEVLFNHEHTSKIIHKDRTVIECSAPGQDHCAIFLPIATGPSNARNVGIEHMWDKTDYFIVLDADDEFLEGKIAAFAEIAVLDPVNIGVIYADTVIENSETLKRTREYREPYSKRRLHQECIVHSGAMISKAALESVKEDSGFYDVNLRTCEDYDLWLRISDKFIIYHIAEPYTKVLVQPMNSTLTVRDEVWKKNMHRLREKEQLRRGRQK